MKKTCFLPILIMITCACNKTTKKLIAGRWNISQMYTSESLEPSLKKLTTEEENNTVFYSNRFIFHKDGTFDINLLQAYLHGNWEYNDREQSLKLTADSSGQTFECHVDSLSLFAMIITPEKKFFQKIGELSDTALLNNVDINTNISHTLVLSFNRETYNNKEKDPYDIANNQWRMQPLQPLNDRQIHARVTNHLNFLRLIFKDALDKEHDAVLYNWFNTPFKLANNGVALKFYEEIKPNWDKNFYDSTEAKEGYELLRKCFSRKINFMQTDNKFLKKVDMLDQMINNMNRN
ncbi:hypothetical protein QTN47_12930 [Danxiaibacter flavus]|uniref:Uncharacterized protein n=1 Tax=Danxiaibacter flavus TaxID=3049108 RepID=A0ABV3ZFX7_9BACT|nr:hypothetical protein QNM32_12935 [Chitinophagaceae bacterium DXS]